MKKIKKNILVILVLIISICAIQFPSLAAGSFSLSSAKTSMTTGESTTLTIKIVDCVGKFNITSSDSSIVSVSSSVISADDPNNVTYTRK